MLADVLALGFAVKLQNITERKIDALIFIFCYSLGEVLCFIPVGNRLVSTV